MIGPVIRLTRRLFNHIRFHLLLISICLVEFAFTSGVDHALQHYEHHNQEFFWHGMDESLIAALPPNRKRSIVDPATRNAAEVIRSSWQLSTVKPSPGYDTDPLLNLHFDQALDTIIKHQYPADCSNKKFLISNGYRTGFASEVHVDTIGLAIAMESGRIYVPTLAPTNDWRFPKSICGERNGLQKCYYHTWTNCTVTTEEFESAARSSSFGRIRMFKILKSDQEDYDAKKAASLKRSAYVYKDEKYLLFVAPVTFSMAHVVPRQLLPLVRSLPIKRPNLHYWWRTISTVFLTRPTDISKYLIQKHAMQSLDRLEGKCVSVFVRHGDKHVEMKLLPFDDYAKVAENLWKLSFGHLPPSTKKTMVLITDSAVVMKEAKQWGQAKQWRMLTNPLHLEIMERTHTANNDFTTWYRDSVREFSGSSRQLLHEARRVLAASSSSINNNVNINTNSKGNGGIKTTAFHRNLNTTGVGRLSPQPQRRFSTTKGMPNSNYRIDPHSNSQQSRQKPVIPEEYAVMLINLVDMLKCDAFVCTLMSNYCRMLDELRSTVARKPHTLFADLSKETCSKPPCYKAPGYNASQGFDF